MEGGCHHHQGAAVAAGEWAGAVVLFVLVFFAEFVWACCAAQGWLMLVGVVVTLALSRPLCCK